MRQSPFVMVVLLFGMTISTGAFEPPPWKPWRVPENGGINALYCYLRSHQVPCSYDSLLKEQSLCGANDGLSATDLTAISAKHGVHLRMASLTMGELAACAKPVLTHMDGETPESGAFLLILSVNRRKITFVNGPSASIHSIAPEDFRRVWSGVALLPSSSRSSGFLPGSLGLLGGILAASAVRYAQRSQPSSKL